MRRRPKTMTISMARKTTAMSTSESEMEAWSPTSNHLRSTSHLYSTNHLYSTKHLHSNNHLPTSNPRWNKLKPRPLSTCSSHFLNIPCTSPTSSDVYVYSKNGYLSPTSNTDINKSAFDSQSNSKLSFKSAQSSFKANSDYEQGSRGKGFTSTSTMSTSNASSSSSLHSLSSQKSPELSSKESKEREDQNLFKSAQDKRDKFKMKNITNNSPLSKNSVGLSEL